MEKKEQVPDLFLITNSKKAEVYLEVAPKFQMCGQIIFVNETDKEIHHPKKESHYKSEKDKPYYRVLAHCSLLRFTRENRDMRAFWGEADEIWKALNPTEE